MTFTASHLLFGKNDIPRRWKDVRQSNLMQLFMDFITLKKFGTHRWMKTWIVSTRQIILSMFFALRTRSANGITVSRTFTYHEVSSQWRGRYFSRFIFYTLQQVTTCARGNGSTIKSFCNHDVKSKKCLTLIWVGFLGVRFAVVGDWSNYPHPPPLHPLPLPKLAKIMLETWNLVRKFQKI